MAGLFRHIGKMRHWEIRLIQSVSAFTAARLAAEIDDGITGLITCTWGADDLLPALARAPIPIVAVDVHSREWEHRRYGVTHLCVDDAGIGREGARRLIDTHPMSCGYIPWPRYTGWSEIRQQAFSRELRKRGFTCRIFTGSTSDRQKDRQSLKAWLKDLPKPAAVMCASDERAMQVLEVCDEPDLAVPDRITMLGVDDDECYCDYSNPPLSSIANDYIDEGYRAAVELERLLSARRPLRARTIVLPFKGFVERLSTRPFNPTENLVKRVQKYILDNAFRCGFSATDAAVHFRLSRRLLDMRFTAFLGQTVSHVIEDVRLGEVRRLLAETNRPFKDIATRCGFPSIGSLRNLFRLRYGMPMRAYRATSSQSDGARGRPDGAHGRPDGTKD